MVGEGEDPCPDNTSQQDPAHVLTRVGQIMREWANYFKFAAAKWTFPGGFTLVFLWDARRADPLPAPPAPRRLPVSRRWIITLPASHLEDACAAGSARVLDLPAGSPRTLAAAVKQQTPVGHARSSRQSAAEIPVDTAQLPQG
jgi:hypothetical protein